MALGDINGDGVPDIIVGAGATGAPQVRVFDGAQLSQLQNNAAIASGSAVLFADFYAFSPNFTGGVTVGAGRLDSTGKFDIIVGAGFGGGPEVKVYNQQLAVQTDFFAFDPNFRGGVNVAAGDIEGRRTDDLVVGAGVGGGSEVKIYRPNGSIYTDFVSPVISNNTGVSVAVGDVKGTGTPQLILGSTTGLTQVVVLDKTLAQLDSFFAYGTFNGGVDVAASTGAKPKLVTGAGLGGAPEVKVFAFDKSVVADFFAFDQNSRAGITVS